MIHGRFVGVIIHMLIARLAGKRVEPQPEHVERRDPGRHQRHKEQQKVRRSSPDMNASAVATIASLE